MNNKPDIKHDGIITQINGNKVFVKIIQNSACTACHAKGACSAADKAEKIIEAQNSGKNIEVGQEVIVTGRSAEGLQAAFLAYLLPFFVLFATLLIVYHFTTHEGISAAAAIGSLVPYYLILFLFKDRLTKKFTFYIN